jgi:hypothetical protein
LDVVLSSDKARKGAEELGDGVNGVADMVMEGTFMEFAREEMVAERVECFFAVAAGGRGYLVKKWKAEFAAEEKSVGVRVETVVRESTG